MVNYTCSRCGYKTKYKGNFRSHLNRKTICPPLFSDIDIEIVRKEFNSGSNSLKNGGTPTQPPFSPHLPPFLTKSSESVAPTQPPFSPHFSLEQPPFSPHLAPIFNYNFGGESAVLGVQAFSDKADFGVSGKKVRDFEGGVDSEISEEFGFDFLSKNEKKETKILTKNDSKKYKKMSKNLLKNEPKIDDEFLLEDDKNEQKLRCRFCNKKFSRVKNKYRHQKHHCKLRRSLQKYEPEDDLGPETKNLEAEILALKREIRNMKSKPHINVEKQQNIGQQQNIIINNYRSENIEYITERVVESLIKRGPVYSIPRLMERIHFNKKHPENHNLAITNVKSKFVHVRCNNTWQVRFLNELLEELVTTKFSIIDEYYEFGGLKEKLSESWKATSYETYRKELLDKNSELRDKIKLKLFESIINFTKVLGLTHKG